MDEDGADRRVFHPEGGGFAVLHLKIVGRIIQTEALRALDLHRIVGSVLQRDKDAAIFVGGHGVHQGIIHAADFKGHIGDALFGIIRVDLNDLHPAHWVVIHGDRLGVFWIDLDGLDTGGFVDGVAFNGLGFLDHNSARDTADANLAVGVGGV